MTRLAALLLVVLLLGAGPVTLDLRAYWPGELGLRGYTLVAPNLRWGFAKMADSGDLFDLTNPGAPGCPQDTYGWLVDGRLYLIRNAQWCIPQPWIRQYSPAIAAPPRWLSLASLPYTYSGATAAVDTVLGPGGWIGAGTFHVTYAGLIAWDGPLLKLTATVTTDGLPFTEEMWASSSIPLCADARVTAPGIRRYRNSAGLDATFACWEAP